MLGPAARRVRLLPARCVPAACAFLCKVGRAVVHMLATAATGRPICSARYSLQASLTPADQAASAQECWTSVPCAATSALTRLSAQHCVLPQQIQLFPSSCVIVFDFFLISTLLLVLLCASHATQYLPGSLAAVPLLPLLLQAALQQPSLLAFLTLALSKGDGLAAFFLDDSHEQATVEVSHFLLSCLDSVYHQVSSTVCSTGRTCGCWVVQCSRAAGPVACWHWRPGRGRLQARCMCHDSTVSVGACVSFKPRAVHHTICPCPEGRVM